MKFYDEWMRDLLHDVSFNLGISHLISTDNEVLFKCLNRIDTTSVLLLGHIYFTK